MQGAGSLTKAKTKAQRRGRTRKQGAREPNGRLQRESVSEIRADVVEARMRQHGLTLVQAGDRLAGYEIGRLYIRGMLDLIDVEVCDDYVQVVANYMALTNPQFPFPRAMDYVAKVKGQGGEPSQEYVNRVRKAYANWSEPLKGCGGIARMAFHEVAFHDMPCSAERIVQVRECIDTLRRAFR